MSVSSRYNIAAALLVCCFFIWGCENSIKEVDELLKKNVAVEEGLGITSYMSSEGRMKAKLTSPYMRRYQSPGGRQSDSAFVEFPKTLHVDFYDDSLRVESMLDAMYARYREYEQKVFLKDSVVVINVQKGDTLRTDELWWDQNKQEFYTEKPVRIFQPDKTIYGQGLRAAQNFTWYDIYHITGIVQTKGDELPE